MQLTNVNEILLISLSCIGDVLLTTPAIKTLKDNFPDAKITVVAGPTSLPILQCHELVDSVVPFYNKGEHKGVMGAARLCLSLRKKKYDLVVDLRNTAMPHFLSARRKITALKSHRKNSRNMTMHAIDRHLDVLEMGGVRPTSREMSVTLPLEALSKIEKILIEKKFGDKRLAAVYPGAGSPYKIYPVEKMAEVLKQIAAARPGAHFVAVGSKEDSPICQKLEELSGGACSSMAGELNILETGALMSKCELLVSNDSGPMHLGAAVRTPTVAIFGPTNADRYGPRGAAHRIVWHKEGCNPCKSPECGQASCIEKIEPVEISKAALEIFPKELRP